MNELVQIDLLAVPGLLLVIVGLLLYLNRRK